ncbi:hypothetical protein CVT24_008881, partial [Panaeolus cyanescens]
MPVSILVGCLLATRGVSKWLTTLGQDGSTAEGNWTFVFGAMTYHFPRKWLLPASFFTFILHVHFTSSIPVLRQSTNPQSPPAGSNFQQSSVLSPLSFTSDHHPNLANFGSPPPQSSPDNFHQLRILQSPTGSISSVGSSTLVDSDSEGEEITPGPVRLVGGDHHPNSFTLIEPYRRTGPRSRRFVEPDPLYYQSSLPIHKTDHSGRPIFPQGYPSQQGRRYFCLEEDQIKGRDHNSPAVTGILCPPPPGSSSRGKTGAGAKMKIIQNVHLVWDNQQRLILPPRLQWEINAVQQTRRLEDGRWYYWFDLNKYPAVSRSRIPVMGEVYFWVTNEAAEGVTLQNHQENDQVVFGIFGV